jgi:hypothetical protein
MQLLELIVFQQLAINYFTVRHGTKSNNGKLILNRILFISVSRKSEN